MSFPIESFIVVGCLKMGSSVCLFLCVCVIQNDFRLYVTIQKHLLNKVWPFVDLCFHVIIYSLIGILIHCGLTGILKGFIYLHLYVCMCVCVCVFKMVFSFDRVHEYDVSLNNGGYFPLLKSRFPICGCYLEQTTTFRGLFARKQ